MKLRILAICLCLLLVTSAVSGCNKDEAGSTAIPSQETESSNKPIEDGPVNNIGVETHYITATDTNVKSTIDTLKDSLDSGTLDEEKYHSTMVNLVLNPESIDHSDGIVLREGQNIDLSNDVQWMIDHYDTLGTDGKAIVDQLTDYDLPDGHTTSYEPSLFGMTAHAADLEPLYPVQIIDNVYLTQPFEQFPIDVELEEMIRMIISNDYENVGNSLGKSKLETKVLISTYNMLPGIDSLSFQHYKPTPDGIVPTFVIHVNALADFETMLGALIHELYHGYQFEMGYTRDSNLEKFLMESTAIWAVKHHDTSLDYTVKYEKYIYENEVFFDPSLMSDDDQKSWFQFYYMMVDDAKDTDFVKEMLENGLGNETLIETITECTDTEEELHNIMAWFGQALFLDAITSDKAFPVEAPYWGHRVDEEQYEDRSLADLIEKTEGSTFVDESLVAAGYFPVIVSLEEYPDSIIDIINNMESTEQGNKSGLAAFVEKDGRWQVLLKGKYTSFNANIDLNKQPTDRLLLLFFNYDVEEVEHEYAVNVQTRIEGEGHIDITITSEDLNPSTNILSDTGNFNIHVTEKIELHVPESETEEMAMMQLILGDIYFVKTFQALLSGKTEIDFGDAEKNTYDYWGEFIYNDGDATPGSLPNNLLSFDFSSLLEAPAALGGADTGGSLGDLLEGMGDLPGIEGLPDMSGLMGELGEAQDEALSELSELGPGAELFFPNPNRLQRMKEMIESETFNLYPTMPPNFTSDDWVNVTTTKKYRDENDDLKTSIEESQSQITIEPLPLWFRNIDYDPEASQIALADLPKTQEEFVANFDDISTAMDQVLVLNGQCDVSNLYNSFDNGTYSFDLSDISSSKEGDQTQELTLFDDGFTGEISGTFIEHEVAYTVQIDLIYSFK